MKFLVFLSLIFVSCGVPSAPSELSSSVNQNCTAFSSSDAQVIQYGKEFIISDGTAVLPLLKFGNDKTAASHALNALKAHNISWYCTYGNSSGSEAIRFFTPTLQRAAGGNTFEKENCVSFEPSALSVRKVSNSGTFWLFKNNDELIELSTNQNDAFTALTVLRNRDISQLCSVGGKPTKKMFHYWKTAASTENPVPAPVRTPLSSDSNDPSVPSTRGMPYVDIYASATTIPRGDSVTIRWNSGYTTGCNLYRMGSVGRVLIVANAGPFGNFSTGPLNQFDTFTVECSTDESTRPFVSDHVTIGFGTRNGDNGTLDPNDPHANRCGPYQRRVMGRCEFMCPDGSSTPTGNCNTQCPAGYTKNSLGFCVPPSCPPGMIWGGNSCIR